MFQNFLTRIFGSRNERLLKDYRKVVARINALEAGLTPLSDEELAACTPALRARLAAGESLDDILPDAFAVCREAARRVLGMRHFDVQMIGGMAMHHGKISEMRTGEGKTLMAALPAYLNALSGKGVHVVTVNDYLAQTRQPTGWAGCYRFLGLSVGREPHADSPHGLNAAWRMPADITYGTNNEFGFDYLRDNMVYDISELRSAHPDVCHRRRGRLHPDR